MGAVKSLAVLNAERAERNEGASQHKHQVCAQVRARQRLRHGGTHPRDPSEHTPQLVRL